MENIAVSGRQRKSEHGSMKIGRLWSNGRRETGGKVLDQHGRLMAHEKREGRRLSKIRLIVRILWRGFLASTFLTILLILIGGGHIRQEGLAHSVLPSATFAAGLCYAIIRTMISGVGRFHAGGAMLAGLLSLVIFLEWSRYEQIPLAIGAGVATGGIVFVGWFFLRKWFIKFLDRMIR